MFSKIKKTKALTLIELLVSIGIIMVTISLAAMFIKYQKPNIELSGGSRDLKNSLQQARALALTTQINHGIRFELVPNTYELLRLGNPPATVASSTLPLNVAYKSIGSFTDNTVSFNASGGASQAGAIVLQNSLGQAKTIIISLSGYVHIE